MDLTYSTTKRAFLAARRDRKHLDVAFVLHLLTEVIGLEALLKTGIGKRSSIYTRSYTHKAYRSPQLANFSVYPSEDDDSNKFYNSLIGNYLKTLMNSHVTDFEAAFNLLKLLCKFEKELAACTEATQRSHKDAKVIFVKMKFYHFYRLPFIDDSLQQRKAL